MCYDKLYQVRKETAKLPEQWSTTALIGCVACSVMKDMLQ